jgi:hypothetical protein
MSKSTTDEMRATFPTFLKPWVLLDGRYDSLNVRAERRNTVGFTYNPICRHKKVSMMQKHTMNTGFNCEIRQLRNHHCNSWLEWASKRFTNLLLRWLLYFCRNNNLKCWII